MKSFGFSTGALALGDWEKALTMLEGSFATALELSVLRERELLDIYDVLLDIDVARYQFVSFHAPSELRDLTEEKLVNMLKPLESKGWPIVVHPNIITDYSLWGSLGEQLYIENMDDRKSKGRTAKELGVIFEKLPSASLCFDIGHARHIDRTMSEAMAIMLDNRERLKMIHLSEVDMLGSHVPLSDMAMRTLSILSPLMPEQCPVILESPLGDRGIDSEIRWVEHFFWHSQEEFVPAAG